MHEELHDMKVNKDWSRILGKEFDDMSEKAIGTAGGASR